MIIEQTLIYLFFKELYKYFDARRNIIIFLVYCRFLVPGWRLGWILVHDRNDAFKDVRIFSELFRITYKDGLGLSTRRRDVFYPKRISICADLTFGLIALRSI